MNDNLRISLRLLWKNKLFSFINVFGLALGLASCFVLLMHVRYETGYDRHHLNRGRIVRVNHDQYAFTPIVMATVLHGYFPEIEKIVRITKFDWSKVYVVKDREFIEEKDWLIADSTFFDVFTVPIKAGSPGKILRSPDRMMISESMAKKYFQEENPVGKSLIVRIMNKPYSFMVEGVYADFPELSHFHANFILSMDYFINFQGGDMTTRWGANSVITYLLLKKPGMEQSMQERMQGFIDTYVPGEYAKDLHYQLQKLLDIHLRSPDKFTDIETQGSITRVEIFTSIAVLVLVIAMVNFILLSLAISHQRTKEFGIRKIVGSGQRELVSLVSTEFFVVYLLSILIALMLVELTIPVLESNMNFRVYGGVFRNAGLLLLFMAIVFFLGYLASIYVTFNVSHIRAIDALKGGLTLHKRRIPTRGILVVFQFTIMIALLSSLIVMQKQIWLLRNKDLGYRKDLLVIYNIPYGSENNYLVIKDQIKSFTGVVSVSGANYVPPGNQWWMTQMKDPVSGDSIMIEDIEADYGLLETLGVKMIEGRTPSTEFGTDSMSVMLNETALKQLQIKDPLDRYLYMGSKDTIVARRNIIGIFRDFHIRSLYEAIPPMAVYYNPSQVHQMVVRIAGSDIQSTLRHIEQKWKEVYTDDPIQFVFSDEAQRLNYLKEDQSYAMITMFTLISLFIAMLGLFGLSAYTMERRTKETGIRKVHGAGIRDIFFSLTRQFAYWTLLAFTVAVPVSWYAMNRWLQHFAYRTDILWWVFALALVTSLVVAGITIGWQTYRAATRNPVEALRYE